MKSIATQYIALKEGRISQANFMRSVRMSLPQYVTNLTSFNDAVRILKNKSILTEMYDGPSEPMGDEAFGDYYEMVGEELETIARTKYNLDDAEIDQMFENEWHSGKNDGAIEKAFKDGDEPSVVAERLIDSYINMDDAMFDDMIQRSEDELGPDKYKFDDFEGGLSEAKEIKVDGKVVKNYKQNGDKSYSVEFEDGSKKQVYVSHDDWDKINDDNLEKKELNEARKKKEPKQPLHPNQIHPSELRMGVKVEMEHTGDPKKAEKIALDHLAENPYYYTALKLSGIESPSAPKAKAPVAAKKIKKKDATEMTDPVNQMQKVKLMKESLEKLVRETIKEMQSGGEGFEQWKQALYNIVMKNANLEADEIAIDNAEIKKYYQEGKTPKEVYFDIWLQDAGNFRNIP
jgi:hypothetical protein